MSRAQNEESAEQTTRSTVERFNEAFNRHDANVLAIMLTEDTVFEDTSPAPDGRRLEGVADRGSERATNSTRAQRNKSVADCVRNWSLDSVCVRCPQG
jgi:hypothetical protein